METSPVHDRDDRIPLPDPAAARRSARRTIWAGIVVVGLLTGFTAGGIAMLAAGETPALPFAIGGPVAQLATIALVATVLWARSGTGQAAVSRSRLVSACKALAGIRLILLVVLAGLAGLALVRALGGDYWTLFTASFIGLILVLLHRGTGRIRRGIEATVSRGALHRAG
ncbi:hypothetical protein [Micromonospora sp. CPCC 205556]|uniref:hypothetical protein n=1 Tax=Micromonospora sp. CPCC 205556 TaxID=3122398 RepID=UPI002FF0FAD8